MSGHERNCCFINTLGNDQAGRRFATASAVSGLDFDDDGRAAAQVDWDHDGDLDLWLTNRNAPRLRFMRNDHPGGNEFVQFQLVGNGVDTNRNAIGARLVVVLENKDASGEPIRLLRSLRAGEGFLSQSSRWMHFGLGKDSKIARVEVQWPNQSGTTESLESIDANSRYVIAQAVSGETSSISRMDDAREGLALESSILTVPVPDLTMRIPLLHQFKAPPLGYYGFDHKPHDFPLDDKTVTLVNLWSTTCAPCVKELKEFTERHDELEKAGIRVLALCIDDLQGMDDAHKNSQAMAERMKFSFTAGMAPATVIAEFQRLHNALIKMQRALPMPSSFLIDRNGRLKTIYKGAVSVDTLLKDAEPSNATLLERFTAATPLKGSLLDSNIVNDPMESGEASVMIQMAKDYVKQKRVGDAINTYKDALQQVPDSPAIHNELALIYDAQGKNDDALRYYRQALELKPENAALNVSVAQILIRKRRYPEAQVRLVKAISLAPENANAHYNLAVVFEGGNEIEKAKSSYTKTLEIQPDHAQALFRLGRMAEQAQDFEKAKDYYERAAKSAPRQPAVLTRLAVILARNGQDLTRAEALLGKAIQYRPRYAEARYQMGRVQVAKGNVNAARQQFLATLQINRRHRGAAMALQQLGQ